MNKTSPKIKINDQEYAVEDLSMEAKSTIASIQFADAEVARLENLLNLSKTARVSYAEHLKKLLAN
jgi:hypothetical protein